MAPLRAGAPAPAVDLLADAAWWCGSSPAAAVSDVAALSDADVQWLPAIVPGTAAAAVRAAHGRQAALRRDYDSEDWWFRTRLPRGVPAGSTLILPGLATVAEVYCDGALIATTRSMFTEVVVQLGESAPGSWLVLRCRALAAELAVRRPRGRWRSSLVSQQGLRWQRTTLLGRAEVFTGCAAPVGPWRGVTLLRPDGLRVTERALEATVDGSTGVLRVSARIAGLLGADGDSRPAQVMVGDVCCPVDLRADGAHSVLAATLELPGVPRWWPRGYGAQPLHRVTVAVAGCAIDLGVVGFRTVAADRAGGGFTLSVNGTEVFCRGAVWAPLDPVGFTADPVGTRAVLARLAEAGLNMVRIPGTTVYEDDAFYLACAELGLLVWQDVMLATLDPAGGETEALLRTELRQLCERLQGNPAVVVVSGGSETEQQPVLLGLPADGRGVPVIEETVPAIVAPLLPGVVLITSSPTGGPLPTHVGTGIAHWFGVGAYLAPPREVRTAGVRFAAECLAFACPPERAAVAEHFGSAALAGHHPAWKATVPRDRGSSWDFEDVRDHYVRTQFGVDPFLVRRVDPELYLDLGRAAVCVAVTEVMTWWRRPRSGCAGGLVLSAVDMEPGPGWGLLDADHIPKAPWHVLRRVCSPVAVLLSDDHLDGVGIDLINDTSAAVTGELTVVAHTVQGTVLTLAERAVRVDAHSAWQTGVDELAGRFLDVNHAYGFGPRAYDAVTVALRAHSGELLAEATWLVGDHARPREQDVGLRAELATITAGWTLTVTTRATAEWVCIDVPGHEPSDSWFHLPAGASRTVLLRAGGSGGGVATPVVAVPAPVGRVRAVNSVREITFGARP